MPLSTVPINFLENWEFIKLASGGVLQPIIGFLQPLQSHQPNPSPTFAGTMSSPTYEHKVQCCKVRHCKHTQVPPISHQAQGSHCNRSMNNWAPRLHVERRAFANVHKLFKQLSTISYLPSRFQTKLDSSFSLLYWHCRQNQNTKSNWWSFLLALYPLVS